LKFKFKKSLNLNKNSDQKSTNPERDRKLQNPLEPALVSHPFSGSLLLSLYSFFALKILFKKNSQRVLID
jgi:hypothetical protein